jgi:hypothetical protein
MNEIDMELWMAQQEGLQAMYQERVANPNRVKTMEEDLAEQMVVAQKAMAGYSNRNTRDAAKFGYDVQVSDFGKIISILNRTQAYISYIGETLAILSGGGVLAGIIGAGITTFFFHMIDGWAKILDIEALLSPLDRREIEALVSESKSLSDQIKNYEHWDDVPPGLKKKLKDYIARTYVAKNNMAAAVEKAKAVYSKKN